MSQTELLASAVAAATTPWSIKTTFHRFIAKSALILTKNAADGNRLMHFNAVKNSSCYF